MALTRTLAELRSEVRSRGDLRAPRHSSSDIDRMINQGIRALFRLLAEVNPDSYIDSYDLSVTSGTATYALPTATTDSEFYKLAGVDVQQDGKWYSLKRFNFSERNQLQDSAPSPRSWRYRVQGTQIRFRPEPGESATVRLWYIPQPATLSSDTDTFDGIAGWEEYVVLWASIRGKTKDRYDTSDLRTDLADIERQIREEHTDRDQAEPDRVRDVTREHTDLDVLGVLQG